MELRLENVKKSYGEHIILEDINLDIKDGELMSIIGPSGVGKTTILNIIAGITAFDSGKIILNNVNITRTPPEKRGVSYIFQSPFLFPHMNVIENICFGLDIRKVDSKHKSKISKRLINSLGLSGLEKQMPYELSGGQQQRVSIARALAIEPKILLMDEPFSSLDPELRYKMGLLIKEIQNEYKQTILFVTHDRNESMSLSDHMSILLDKTINQVGTPEEVYYKPLSKEIASFMGISNFISVKNKTLFLRPHQIKIVEERGGYTIKNRIFNGKEIKYEVSNDKVTFIVEDFSVNPWNIGDNVGIKIIEKDVHYI